MNHCHKNHDHVSNHQMMMRDFKKRFFVSLVLTLPILALSPAIQSWFNYEFTFLGDKYVLFFLSSIVFFYGGFPFVKGSYKEILSKNLGMMTLIAVAIIVSYVYSAFSVFGLTKGAFFWELVTLIDIMLLGHWLEMKSVIGASRALELIAKLMPSVAHVIKDSIISDISLEKLEIDDVVLVKDGERIPADGDVVEGESYVNESMLTGESKPVVKKIDDKVIGGSISSSGILKIRVKRTGADSYISRIIELVKDAQKAKSKNQILADIAAKWLTLTSISIGSLTLIIWFLVSKNFAFALERMVTVMVITCPHALGLAVPLVVSISTSIAAKNGLLIRNRNAFENSREISAVMFDKTGTLTYGNFVVSSYKSLSQDYSDVEILRLAGSLERNSKHPIAFGIMQEVNSNELLDVSDFKNVSGKGVFGLIDNKNIGVVSSGFLNESKISIPDNVFEKETETVVFVLVDDKLVGFIALSDQIRPESYEAVKSLKKRGIKVLMITGDNKNIAKSVSDELGLDDCFYEVLPHQKLEIIKEFQKKGEFVAMTGDGINDAPALAQADVGIAIGSGTDIAAETADIILVKSNPLDIVSLISFGSATYKKMIQNLIWATGYNIVAIPIAAGALYHFGIMLNPAFGAILMSLSTIIVAFNAQLLTKIR